MSIYKLKQNEKTLKSFNFLDEALDYMHLNFEKNKSQCLDDEIHFSLVHETENDSEILLKLPQIDTSSLKDFHPLIQYLFRILYNHQDELLLELDSKLKCLDRLNDLSYTKIPGNNNFLDLIKLADLTDFCVLHCPTCKKLQYATAEGCSELIFFVCNECDSIIIDLHRKE